MRKRLCMAFASALGSAVFAIETEKVDLGYEGAWDGTVTIERTATGALQFKDAEVGPVTLTSLLLGQDAAARLEGYLLRNGEDDGMQGPLKFQSGVFFLSIACPPLAASRALVLPAFGGTLARIEDIAWGSISGTLANQSDLQAALNSKSNVAHTHDATSIVSGNFPTDRYSAYADLTAEGKIGLGAGQLAPGDHAHAGQPVGNTLRARDFIYDGCGASAILWLPLSLARRHDGAAFEYGMMLRAYGLEKYFIALPMRFTKIKALKARVYAYAGTSLTMEVKSMHSTAGYTTIYASDFTASISDWHNATFDIPDVLEDANQWREVYFGKTSESSPAYWAAVGVEYE